MLDPKLGLTLRTRTLISILVTAGALALFVSPSLREMDARVREATHSTPGTPSDPVQALPSMFAEAIDANIADGGLDGAQTHLTARPAERAESGSRRRNTVRPRAGRID